jgi:ABC-2 type transport system permease protein
MVVAVGGDGTMLSAAATAHRADIPVLGFNMGTLGFLAAAEPADLESVVAPLWALAFALLGSLLLGVLGLLAGLWAEKFDQIAAFQNFLILPLTMLSGVFYSIHSLPAAWQSVSHLNPFFYMIDGFRFGFFGASDFSPAASLAVVAVSLALLSALTLRLLKNGYKLRT